MKFRRRGITGLLAALSAGSIVLVITAVPVLAMLAAAFAASIPRVLSAQRARKQAKALRAAWPGVIDEAVSATRAGVPAERALIDALAHLPEPAATAARAMAADVRATGKVEQALAWFGAVIDDPVADRLLLVVRLTRRLGSPDAVKVLEQVADNARQEQQLHEIIEARRSWITASALMASAAPWLIVLSLSTRDAARAAYSSETGTAVLLVSASLTVIAYVIMQRIGRIQSPARMAVKL